MMNMNPYRYSGLNMGRIILESGKDIVKAEQTKPNSRAARRQEAREQARKWAIKYKEEQL